MENKTIIFYAPIGNGIPKHKLGGGERGCRRTIEILKQAGYKVITIDKPVMDNGILNYLKMAIIGYFNLLRRLSANKDSILYVVGFYEKNIYLEYINIFTGKLFGKKVIYEARNGRLVKAYNENGNLYKKIMDSILLKSDILFCQGLEYIDFIQNKYEKCAIYTPNYVMNSNLKEYNEMRIKDKIKLLYLGRVTKSKNINIIIEIYDILRKKGHDVELIIIGGYQEEYKKELDEKIKNLDISLEKIKFLGQQSFENIGKELQNAHFFVFPSEEKKEGHSNALTEAMTFGVVPIVSTAGFNKSIVSNKDLVVNSIDANNFADIIDKIIRDKSWDYYSRYVYERVKNNYTEDIVKSSIIEAIRSL